MLYNWRNRPMINHVSSCPDCGCSVYFFYNNENFQCRDCNKVYPKPGTGIQELAPKNNILEAKPDMSLLPLDLLEGLARAYEYGLVKPYPRNSWRKGFKQSVSLAAALRHITDYKDKGQMFDPDAKERANMDVYHIDMAIFNLLCVKDSILNHPELDDRYIREEKDE